MVKKGGGIGLAKDCRVGKREREGYLALLQCMPKIKLITIHTHTHTQTNKESERGLHMQANDFQEW